MSRKALGPMVALAASLLCWPSGKTYCQLPCRYVPEKSRKSPTQFGWCHFFCFLVLLKGCSLSHVCLKKAPIPPFSLWLCFWWLFFSDSSMEKYKKSLTAKSPFGFSNREISSQKTAWMKKHLYAEKIDSWMSQKG